MDVYDFPEEETAPGVPVDMSAKVLTKLTVPVIKAELTSRCVYFPLSSIWFVRGSTKGAH